VGELDVWKRSDAYALVVGSETADVVEVIESELLSDVQPMVGHNEIEALLNSYLTHRGRLIPARTAMGVDDHLKVDRFRQ